MFEHRYELKACEGCGYVRRVCVRDCGANVNGVVANHDWQWAKLCEACKYEESARVHEFWAKKNRETAGKLRAIQEKRAAKRAEEK